MTQPITLTVPESGMQPTINTSVVTDHWQELCNQLSTEQNPERLTTLISKINSLRFAERQILSQNQNTRWKPPPSGTPSAGAQGGCPTAKYG
jgi:hypothetical protein